MLPRGKARQWSISQMTKAIRVRIMKHGGYDMHNFGYVELPNWQGLSEKFMGMLNLRNIPMYVATEYPLCRSHLGTRMPIYLPELFLRPHAS
jgi:hypothetical protein